MTLAIDLILLVILVLLATSSVGIIILLYYMIQKLNTPQLPPHILPESKTSLSSETFTADTINSRTDGTVPIEDFTPNFNKPLKVKIDDSDQITPQNG